MENKKSFLLLFDGSENNAHISNYANQLRSFKDGHVVLYHVLNPMPECFWDMQRIPQTQKSISELIGWEERQKELITRGSQNICQHLIKVGFEEDRIEVKIHHRNAGIARDILEESKEGEYTAVVLQRRGQSNAKSINVGSVASKLFLNLHYCPLLIAGSTPFQKRLLIAIDGSNFSLKAVDFVIENLSPDNISIGLIHAVRGFGGLAASPFETEDPSTFFEAAQSAMKDLFSELRGKLIRAGFGRERIEMKIFTGVGSRAETICAEAAAGGYDTIVIGRKGISQVEEFSMGRVCSKIIQIAESFNVWVM
jgi:nucleotide-binding universal stress UspA family protein